MLTSIKKYVYNFLHPAIGEVWMLHRVTDKHADTELQRTYEITPARLELLIVEYQNKGYEFISIQEVAERMALASRLSSLVYCLSTLVSCLSTLVSCLSTLVSHRKFVAVTLDDGYRDNYELAYPIFKKYNVPFCVYLLQSEVSGEVMGKYPMLTENQILELDKDPLCTMGGHTYSHPRLETLSREQQYEEIVRCKDWMENMLGHKVVDYSYPFGSFNQDTIDILREIGICQCPMAWGGEVRQGKGTSLLIPRRLVTENEIK